MIASAQWSGFQITAPADTSSRTLIIYCGVHQNAQLSAFLSDGSAATITDTSVTSPGEAETAYAISYQAASAGQTMTVKLLSPQQAGYVALQAAVLR